MPDTKRLAGRVIISGNVCEGATDAGISLPADADVAIMNNEARGGRTGIEVRGDQPTPTPEPEHCWQDTASGRIALGVIVGLTVAAIVAGVTLLWGALSGQPPR